MAGKTVLHFEKNGKSSGGSLGPHIDREPGKEYSYRHADLSRTKDNIFVQVNKLCLLPYNQAIQKRIDQGYSHRNKAGELKAIRKDAVHSINVILSGSHEEMLELQKKNRLQEWIRKNLEYCKKEFGEENITRFAVHLDEKTPHIHCVFVPITEDGRLSAGDWVGTGKQLEDHQTKYAEAMKEFGLERGLKSDRKHHTTEEYRKREASKLNENKDIFQELEELKQTDVFGFKAKKAALFVKLENLILNADETTKKEIEGLKSQISHLEMKNSKLVREYHEIPKSNFLSKEQIKAITESVSVRDYFLSLMERGKIDFVKKSGKELYFKTGDQKFSVSDKGYFDFKSNSGGQIIKAVMEMEGIKWKDALDFLQKFSGTSYSHLQFQDENKDLKDNYYHITTLLTPNNPKLLSYFEGRGISREVLKENTRQVHYQVGQKHYFGIGMKNNSGGFEIRGTDSKMKLGNSNITQGGNPHGKKMVVFEGMSDMLAYIQAGKDKGLEKETQKLICLNSVTNVQKFIEQFQDYKGEMELCLDADEAGEKATKDLQTFFTQAEDVRELFGIYQGRGGAKDFNERLMLDKGLMREYGRGRKY
jgi:hypothetical protein